MNTVLLWIVGLLVAAIGLVFAVPYAVDWNSYRGVFEEEASRILGREVRVDGNVGLRLLPVPYVSFEQVSVADAGGQREQPFFAADSFTLWLSVQPLLRGVIEARDAELDGVRLKLAVRPDGSGNWQTFEFSPGNLPFVPRDVALKSVKITNGQISLRANGAEMTLAAVEGEFSTAAIEGPYRFRGDVSWNDVRWEARFSTATREADGSLRFKLTARASESGNSYLLDATASNGPEGPRIEGTATAHLAPANASQAFDIQALVGANTRRASLKDVALSFEQEGRPQLVTGNVQFTWGRQFDTSGEFRSRLLDVDHILGAGAESCPSTAVLQLAQRAAPLLPAGRRTNLKLGADLINLGGESISGLELAVSREGGAVAVRELKAGLPGNATIEVRGAVAGDRSSEGFDGELKLQGPSLQRFLAWAGKCRLGPLNADAAFLLSSKVRFAGQQAELTQGTVEIAGKKMQAGLRYRPDGAGVVALTLEGADIDLAPLAPGILNIETLSGALGGRGGEGNGQLSAGWSKAEIELQIRAGALGDGERVLRDVHTDLVLKDGTLKISALKFATEDGVRADVQGELANLSGAPRGQLKGSISAVDRRSVDALANILPRAAEDAARLVRNNASVGINFSAEVGARGPKSLLVKADGTLDKSRLSGELQLADGLGAWRESPLEVSVRLENPVSSELFRQMTGTPGALSAPLGAGPGAVELKLKGASGANLQAAGYLKGTDLEVSYKGSAALTPEGRLTGSGEMSLALTDAARSGDASGVIDIVRDKDRLWLEPRGLKVGKTRLSGRVEVTGTSGQPRLDARLEASEATLAQLLGPILAPSTADGAEDPASRSATSPWPDTPFSFDLLKGLEGRVRLAVGSLQVADGITLRNADLAAELSPEQIKITKLEGQALGGRSESTFTLDRTPGGATLAGEVRVKGFRLDEIGRRADGQSAPGAGELNVSLRLNGRAFSPRALVAAMTGKGEAEIRAGRVGGVAPEAVTKAAATFLTQPEDPTRNFTPALNAALAGSSLPLGTRKLSLEVGDGALKVGRLVADTREGRATNDTTIDLVALKVDSEWRLEAKRDATTADPSRARQSLPAVSMVYVGHLAQLAAIEPRISADSLERELSVRRMEREVDRLENLRKQDQERARETERKQGAVRSPGPGAGVIHVPFPIPASPAQTQTPR